MPSNLSFNTTPYRSAVTGSGPTAGSPLAPLYSNPYDFSSLSYPRDLGATNRGHWIQIYINVAENTQYAARNSNGQIVGYNVGNSTVGVVQNGGRTATNQAAAASAMDGLLGSSQASLTVRKTKRISQAIALYMPETVNVQYNANWQSESLTDALGSVGLVGSVLQDLKDANRSVSGLSGQAAELAGKALAGTGAVGSNAADFALFTQGLAINPQLEVLFKGTDMRHFQFDFLFSPYDAQESAHVVYIIKTLKFHQAPEVVTGSSGRFFVPPSEFDIDFIFEGEINPNIHQIGTCVLTNMNVDYAPNGWSTFSDGMPTHIRLTLQFMETEIVTKQRVAQDNY